MDLARLPPLSALRAFAAFAQTGSVVAAGAALNVSHAAISQQLRKLEAHLGLTLLDRSGRQMALTAEGRQLAQALDDAFGRMGQVIDALTGADAARPLHIGCTASFAAAWLMPRLARFREIAPEVELMLDPSPALTDPVPGGLDVAIRYGQGPWPGVDHAPLMPAPVVLVGAPTLFPDGPPATKDAIYDFPWIFELGNNEALVWRRTLGIDRESTKGISRMPGNLMIDAARAGQGLALTTRLAVAEDIAAGRLVALYEADDQTGYNIVTAPGVPRPPLRTFLRWLRREAAATGREIDAAKIQ